MPTRLPLTALRAFEAAARYGSLTAAASELGVTRPAISKQIKQLEQAAEREQLERLAACTQYWPSHAANAPLNWLESLAPQPGNHDALQTLRIATAQLSA